MYSEEQEITSWVMSHLPHYLAEAEAWLAITRAGEPAGSLQDAVHHQLQQRGLIPTRLDARRAVLSAEEKGSTPTTVLLYYHYDARADMAAALLPFLASLAMRDLYHTRARPLPITVQWLIDGSGLKKFFPTPGKISPLKADYILWLAIHQARGTAPTLALGHKGYLSVTLSVETAATPLASSYGAIMPNAAWRLLWALNHLKNASEDILIEGFYDKLVPADDQLLEALYTSLPTPLPAHADQSPPFLLQLRGFQLNYAHLLLPTCSVVSFESQPSGQTEESLTTSMLPSRAQAQVDFYLVPAQDPEDIFAKLQQHLQHQGFSDVLLRRQAASYASSLAPTHPFVTTLRQAVSEANGGLPGPTILPLTPENFAFANTPQTPPLLVYTMEGMTGEKEQHVDTESYARAIKQLVLLIERLRK